MVISIFARVKLKKDEKMEKEPQKDNSRLILAIVLIALGVIWLMHKAAPFIYPFGLQLKNLFFPFRQLFAQWGSFLFSWQVVLILVGLILLAGKRSAGMVLIVLGGLFLVPKIFVFFPFTISLSLMFPVILIAAGIALIARLV
jgi:hypothetical protein